MGTNPRGVEAEARWSEADAIHSAEGSALVTNFESGGYNFRYNTRQWLDFARFMDFIYEQQRRFEDDLSRVVILRAVGQSEITHGRGVNASSIADALKLPRETARRKCLAMVEDGWLERDGNEFRLGQRVASDVLLAFEENIERLIDAADEIKRSSD